MFLRITGFVVDEEAKYWKRLPTGRRNGGRQDWDKRLQLLIICVSCQIMKADVFD